jgi:hypothetical protein
MANLYPRLLPADARLVHDELQHLPLQELASRHDIEHAAAVFTATGGDRVERVTLQHLRENLLTAAHANGFPEPPSVQRRIVFDNGIGPMLHRTMGVVPAEAAAGDVWAFLSLILAPDVTYWRFRREGERVDPDRTLGTDLTRHVFARLWWRANLLFDPNDPDPYEAFSAIGEAAFDQILARRRALGASPTLVKSILRVWRKFDQRDSADRQLLRDFLMRLLRLAPIMAFETLPPARLDAELALVARECIEANRSSVGYE